VSGNPTPKKLFWAFLTQADWQTAHFPFFRRDSICVQRVFRVENPFCKKDLRGNHSSPGIFHKMPKISLINPINESNLTITLKL
jgi:hypothetical protein